MPLNRCYLIERRKLTGNHFFFTENEFTTSREYLRRREYFVRTYLVQSKKKNNLKENVTILTLGSNGTKRKWLRNYTPIRIARMLE